MSTTSAGVLNRFHRLVQADPNALAVVDGTLTLTRYELSLRAEAVTSSLLALGVSPGDRVGVCVDRSAALLVAVLGVVRAGAAYVAIDPAYPEDRIDWMLEDCGAVAAIAGAESRLADRSSTTSSSTTITLARDGGLSAATSQAAGSASPPRSDGLWATLHGSDPAYVVYTSGSTGQPKGVTIDHGGLANLVGWHCGAFGVNDTDHCTQMASPGFDAAVWEIWPALAAGAALHIVPEPLKTDPLGLRDWLVGHEITVGFVPTALAEGLITLEWPEATALRHMLVGGDALTRRPDAGLPFTLVNNYGVSEATVVATSGPVDPAATGAPSIGRPIHGVLAEILDDSGAKVSDGTDGELVLGGVAVGLGYVNRPELTAERFYEDERGRWYRTGDRMRFTATGELEFLGRLDDQLSIRGFRVEPAEIAAALNAHPGVSASVAIAAGSSSAERRLIAYVVGVDGARPSEAELADSVASLPEHMRPSSYVWLDALPMTVHGKVDRTALPNPGTGEPTHDALGVAPGVEATIAAIAAELLGVTEVGVNDNLFLLGGHSMLGAQLIIRLSELYDVEVTLRYLFDHPTATELAVEVEAQRGETDAVMA